MTKLVLVSTGSEKVGHPPLGLGYLVSYLRKYLNFNDVKIIDKEKDVIESIIKENPEIIGISASTHFFNDALDIGKKLKDKLNVPILIGGSHITLLPRTLGKEFDIAVMGEGEETLLELMKTFLDDNEFNNKNLKNIKGIAFHNSGKVVVNERRPLIEPLDKIPYPARDLFKMKEEYLMPRVSFSLTKISRSTHILTSRGCPYNCVFCSSSCFWQKIRFNSAEYIVGELKKLVRLYKINEIFIFDDLFVVNKERLKKIIELMESENLLGKLKFKIHGRTNLIDEEICKLLDKLNVKDIAIGFESQSPKILKYLKKGTTTIEQNQRTVDLIKKSGLMSEDVLLTGYFMIGTPNETREDMMMTLDFIKNNPIDTMELCITTPLPGTELWEYAKQRKLVYNNMDWDKLNMKSVDGKENILLTEEVSRDEFVKICKEFNTELERRNNVLKQLKLSDLLSFDLLKFGIKNYDKSSKILYSLIKNRIKCLLGN